MIIPIWQNRKTNIPPEQSKSIIGSNQVLSGSTRYALKNEYGMILIQEYEGRDFIIVNGILESKKAYSVFLQPYTRGLHIITSLKNNLKIRNNGSRQHIQPGFYGYLQNDGAIVELLVRKNEPQSFISVHITETLLQQLLTIAPVKVLAGPQILSGKFSEIIQSLINAPYQLHQLHFFYENKVRELLFEIITREHRSNSVETISSVENNIIHMLDHTMRYSPWEHRRLHEMSLSSGLSIFKLKAGFKANFGMAIFERLIYWRIQMARKLLRETNKPVKEIAGLAGYKRLTSFITIFRKRTGFTPGDYRNAAEADITAD